MELAYLADTVPRQVVLEHVHRLLAGYREFGGLGLGVLSDYWERWSRRALFFCFELADEVFYSPGTQVTGVGERVGEDEDTVTSMQVSGRRMTMAERMARPHRPREWQELLASLRELDPRVASRTMSIVRRRLMQITEQQGATFTVLGMMLRDMVAACSLFPRLEVQDAVARREVARVIEAVHRFLRERLESPGGAS